MGEQHTKVCPLHSGIDQKIGDVAADTAYIRGRVDEVVAFMNRQKGVTEGRRPYVTWIAGIVTVITTNVLSGIWGAKYAIAHAIQTLSKGLPPQ